MNEHDSQKIACLLRNYNYKITDDARKADLIVLNTCSIREKAEHKVYSELGRLKEFKDRNPRLIIGVGGCVAQQEGEKLLRRVSHLDLVFGTQQIHRLPQFIARVEKRGGRFSETSFSNEIEYLNLSSFPEKEGSIKSYVTIMQGCDNFCSYCVVPYVRGRERCRSSKKILEEIETLCRRGIKEVVLLGQNVNSYGRDLPGELSFSKLLSEIDKIEGIERIRFVTSHPKDFSDELISSFESVKKLCEHIHLPVQSGSNLVLKRMNRGYTREEYLDKIRKLREVKPSISITSDIIVGFPGEREEDFQDTLTLLGEVKFDGLFSFKYSARPKTKAATFSDQVPEETKIRRLNILQRVQAEQSFIKNRSLEGRVEEVLIEGISKTNKERVTGRTGSNKIVNFKGNPDLVGKLVLVRIKEAFQNSLYGEALSA
jgi:tRNA-2-methylthio-N6-dimethylallyladenosine synthase